MTKVIFIPGNSGGSPKDIWFPSVKMELEANGLQVISEEFPDNDLARSSIWIPFLINDLKADKDTILVGHSSGAVAAMRFAEHYPLQGSVLVGPSHTDLGIEKERLSGYFDTPWQWSNIRNNQTWIALFASQDDPFIPVEQARYIHTQLNCEYHEFEHEGHFIDKLTFPELSQGIIRRANDCK